MHLRAAARIILSASCLIPFALLPTHGQEASPTQVSTVRVGAKSIALPSPSADLVETGPDYRVLLEPLAPTTNRLAAAFVSPDDLTSLHSGTFKPMTNYALVETFRTAEFTDIDPAMFKEICDGIGQQFGDGSFDAMMKDEAAELNHSLKELNSASSPVTIDKTLPLGSFFTKPNANGFGMIMPVSTKGTTVKLVMSVTVLRVRDRILFSYLCAVYKDENTVLTLRKTAEQWADSILKANTQ